MSHRARRYARILLAAIIIVAIISELIARYGLGLGDPPLSVADPEIEYLFRPSRTYRRFGNTVSYNAYSMRSPDFPRHKTQPNELRVMMLGDSIINGGAQTDQSAIATTLLQDRLQGELNRPVVLGNVSAGSWGPPNLLAYVGRYGLFDADVVVIVLSSHDYADVPSFTPIVGVDPNFPDSKPWLATQEAITRYLPRLIHRGGGGDAAPGSAAQPGADAKPEDVEASIGALKELIRLARQSGATVILAQHLDKKEASSGELLSGHAVIAATAAEAGVQTVQLGDAFRAALAAGKEPYRDDIHPNAQGQQLLTESLLPVILSAARTRPTTSPATPATTVATRPG